MGFIKNLVSRISSRISESRELNFAVNCCKNPRCQNFGISIDASFKSGQPGYKLTAAPKNKDDIIGYECRYCGLSSTQILSNKSLKAVYQQFLADSFPFATCRNTECEVHGVNLFEHYRDGKRKQISPFRFEDKHRAVCRFCQTTFYIGSALNITQDKHTQSLLNSIYNGAVTNRTLSQTIDYLELGISHDRYYSTLRNLSHILRDYQSYRLSELLAKRYRRSDTARVYTDVMDISLQRGGNVSREGHLYLIISVLALEGSYFILAAHPCFMPDKAIDASPIALVNDAQLPLLQQQYHHLQHPFKPQRSKKLSDAIKAGPDVGRDGFFIERAYAAAVHFMVIKKLLKRFPKIHFYVDAEKVLYTSAASVFAPDIKDHRVDIVVFQHIKGDYQKGNPTAPYVHYEEDQEPIIRKELESMQQRFNEQLASGIPTKSMQRAQVQQQRAMLFKRALKGARSEVGQWAWLTYPQHTKQYKDVKTLWYTQREDDPPEAGIPLLLKATLQPVDSAINLLRSHISGANRPAVRAKPGRSFVGSYYEPWVVISELWINLFARNYTLRRKTAQKTIPARQLGLLKEREIPINVKRLFKFRYNQTHTQQVTHWTDS